MRDGLQWYALVVAAQKEFVVERLLQKRGYKAMVPIEVRWRRASRHTRKMVPWDYPMFPRYVFAGFHGCPPWHELAGISMVRGVVGFNGVPSRLPDGAIQTLERISGSFLPGRAPGRRRSFSVGDDVVIEFGVLHMQRGRLQKITGKRAKVLLDFFNSTQEVDLPIDFLAAA